MTSVVNPILSPTALLRPQMPGVYNRNQVYDPTYNDPSYANYQGQRIVPAVGSLVRDSDQTPLWVVAIDPVSFIPAYQSVPLATDNDNVVSLLNYGNTVFRLYGDYRKLPYPVTPDSKCIFIGKSPRFYTLSRYPNSERESVISQYFNASGTLVSQMVPMIALDQTNSSWYLPRSHVSVLLEDNEEILLRVFSEDGIEVYSALFFAKQSVIINEDVLYSPTIVGLTVTGNQVLADGSFYLYEKQDFESLGLIVTLVYDNGATQEVPIDGVKCLLYGQSDFISSFAGLKQNLTIKYFRSPLENISPTLADPTGAMVSTTVSVTVIPNTLASTVKIVPIPIYNSALNRYTMKYWLYSASGNGKIDVFAYTSIVSGTLDTSSAYYGRNQSYTVAVDMSQIDPVHYPTQAIYQQSIYLNLQAPNSLVRYTFKDAASSPYIFGIDITNQRRAVLRYDQSLNQYFIPSFIFANKQAVINSFYTPATPPFDPSVSQTPQQPTHFVVRDPFNGNMLTATPISLDQYSLPFSFINDSLGNYKNATVIVEFLYIVNNQTPFVLYGVPVDISPATYIAS